ncbi:hypothetical protein GGS23DRAFT_569329, partial [Durotheca rogersii]|uniref:uncharacterized protein n=1 Tax=Durotheca rogersii TaxID=419775 RepID=UPI002220E9F5
MTLYIEAPRSRHRTPNIQQPCHSVMGILPVRWEHRRAGNLVRYQLFYRLVLTKPIPHIGVCVCVTWAFLRRLGSADINHHGYRLYDHARHSPLGECRPRARARCRALPPFKELLVETGENVYSRDWTTTREVSGHHDIRTHDGVGGGPWCDRRQNPPECITKHVIIPGCLIRATSKCRKKYITAT